MRNKVLLLLVQHIHVHVHVSTLSGYHLGQLNFSAVLYGRNVPPIQHSLIQKHMANTARMAPTQNACTCTRTLNSDPVSTELCYMP